MPVGLILFSHNTAVICNCANTFIADAMNNIEIKIIFLSIKYLPECFSNLSNFPVGLHSGNETNSHL